MRRKLRFDRTGMPIVREAEQREWERVSPFDMFPAPSSKGIDDGWLIERHTWSEATLASLIGVTGFDEENVREALRRYRDSGREDLTVGDSERHQLENQGSFNFKRGTIEVIELWDDIRGETLIEWYRRPKNLLPDGFDPDKTYSVSILACGDLILSVELNGDPLGRKPYGMASFIRNPGSFWGTALPEVMADVQDICNAAARALVNNMGIASGPQVVVDVDRVPPGQNLTSMYPWKMWQVSATLGAGDPVKFFNPKSNAPELMAIYEKFASLADDYTGIPSYMYGDAAVGGAGGTASGLSMLMGAASRGIKQAVRHFDEGIVERLVTLQFTDNLLSGDVPYYGESRVIARGSGAIIAKEALQVRRKELLQVTSNPIDMQIIGLEGRAKMLHDTFSAAGMAGVMPDPAEAAMAAQIQQSQPAQMGVADQQRALTAGNDTAKTLPDGSPAGGVDGNLFSQTTQ